MYLFPFFVSSFHRITFESPPPIFYEKMYLLRIYRADGILCNNRDKAVKMICLLRFFFCFFFHFELNIVNVVSHFVDVNIDCILRV